VFKDLAWSLGCKVCWFKDTLVVFLFYLANISSLSLVMGYLLDPEPPPCSFFSSFTLSAYRRVFKVCSHEEPPGPTLAIIVVLLFPVNESLRTCVSLLPRKGVCFLSRSRALMHSFRARSDLLISAPSIRVWREQSMVSAPLSLPAKSMNDIFPLVLESRIFLS
jgi:hypothetical protein